MSENLPFPLNAETEVALAQREGGLNSTFDQIVHCVAAEPHAVFLRVGVSDAEQEVAYMTVVLGRLRRGYRVLPLRSPLGTQIEICVLFVKISFGTEDNLWATARQVRACARARARMCVPVFVLCR